MNKKKKKGWEERLRRETGGSERADEELGCYTAEEIRGGRPRKAGRTPGDTDHSVPAPATEILACPQPTVPGASDLFPCMLLSTAWEASFRSSKVSPAGSHQILGRNISCGLQETTMHSSNPC